MIRPRLISARLREISKTGFRGVPCRLHIGLSLWNRMDFSAFRRGINPLAPVRRSAITRHRFGRIRALVAARVSRRIGRKELRVFARIRQILRDCGNLPFSIAGILAMIPVKRIFARRLHPGSIRSGHGSRLNGHSLGVRHSRMICALRCAGRCRSVDDGFKLPMESVRVFVAPRMCRDKY